MKTVALIAFAALLSGCAAPVDLRGQETVCQVHHVPLQDDTVHIAYGLLCFPPGYWDAEKSLFPNARPWVGGGCSVLEPDRAYVRFCPECRQAREQWMAEHGGQ
jgi:hypothetical protein